MKAQAHDVFIDSENLKVLQVHIVHCPKFLCKLIAAAVDMGIVHVQAAYPHQSEQLTTLFIAVAGPIFGKANRKFPVASGIRREYLMMMRAVHGFQVVFSAFQFHGREHTILIVRQMSAGQIHTLLSNMRGDYPLITGCIFCFFS